MPRFLIPTRNRPASLRELLRFLERFYPCTSLLLADGSDDPVKDEVQAVLAAEGAKLDIRYLPYPADLPFFERMLDAAGRAEDDFLALGADDDYPLVDVYDRAERLLVEQDDVVNVVPGDVVLTQRDPNRLTARLSPSRDILSATAKARARNFAWWSFATSYGVSRRDAVIARYRMMTQFHCPGFIDFQIGIDDALNGSILALGAIGTIRTQTYQHAYYRPTTPLVYLRKAKLILAYRDHIAGRLVDSGLDGDAAQTTASRLIDDRVTELSGVPAPARIGFEDKPAFDNPALQEQFRQFYAMFDEGSEIRETLDARLAFAAGTLRNEIACHDHDARGNYETI